MKDNYNFEKIKEKLNICKNIKLEDVTLDDVDELGYTKIESIERI